VQTMIEKKYPTIYSVFSGGDDLFVLGPWDILPEFILELESKFKMFAAQNPCVTLSAAIVISNPKNHIAALAEICEKKLKIVKNSTQPLLYPDKEGRNGVYFMNQIFSWEDLTEQLGKGMKLSGQATVLPRAILRRIAQYSKMYRHFLKTQDVFSLSFEPMFYYDRKRNYEKINKDRFNWFLDYAGKLTDNAANYKVLKKDLFFADTVIRFALNKTKEERERGI
jgi:CRISPR-associated protein Csm1